MHKESEPLQNLAVGTQLKLKLNTPTEEASYYGSCSAWEPLSALHLHLPVQTLCVSCRRLRESCSLLTSSQTVSLW